MASVTILRILHILFCSVLTLTCPGLTNDVILGGIFPEHFAKLTPQRASRIEHRSPCGELNQGATVDKVAMYFAVKKINNDDSILPGISLGFDIKDSCSNLDHAIQNTLHYPFVKMKFLDKSVNCSPQGLKNECCLEHGIATEAPLMAVIGGGYSHIVKAVVNLVGLFKVPVIGYSSTSPSLNKIDYFLRTVPPDTVTAQVMVELVQRFHWNIVLLLYASTDFGHYAADSFRTAIREKNAKICIAFDDKFSQASGEREIERIVNGIKNTKQSRVVAFFGTIEDFVFFHGKSKRHLNFSDYMWISSEIWLRPDLMRISPKLTSLISIIPKQSFPLDRFYDYVRARKDVNLTCLPNYDDSTKHYRDIEANMKMMGVSRVRRSKQNNCSLSHSKFIPHVFDAVYSAAMALHNMLECEPGVSCQEKLKRNGNRSLLDYLKNLNFTNPLTNNTVSFDSNGNPNAVHYTAVKIEVGENWYKLAPVGHWACQRNKTACEGRLVANNTGLIDSNFFKSNCGLPCAKGEYKSVKEKFPDCCWECLRCSGNTYTNSSSQMSCSECQDDHWPNSNHTSCAKILPEFLHMNTASGILIVVWDSLGISLCVLVGVVFVRYSSSHIVRASSSQLSLLLLLGITMDFSLLISLLTEPTRKQCTTIFFLSHVTSCLLTGTLFLKTNRIHRIFRKSAMKAHPRCMGNTYQLSIILVLVLIELTLSGFKLFFYPKTGHVRVTYVYHEDRKKAFLLCNFLGNFFQKGLFDVLLWSYDCGMIFICTYQAYLVRKVPENYNEARYITFTMVTVSMTIVVYIIIDSGMEGHNLELVYCIFQTVRTSIALGCMFFPKVYIILFQPEKNVPHDPFQSKLGTFVEDERTDKVEPDENACNSSSLDQSVSSANSNASCTTAVIGRSQRKVSAQTDNTNNSRASADSAN